MKDKFADLEEPKTRTWPAAVVISLVVLGMFVFHLSQAKPERLVGTVEAVESNAIRVQLESGAKVSASKSFSGVVSTGDRVVVVEDRNSISGPIFQVTGKEPSR